MFPTPSCGARTRSCVCAAIALAVIGFAPLAHAGIGGFSKALKDKAAKAAGQQVESKTGLDGEAVQFNDTMVELTGERLDAIVAGLKAGRAATSGRPALVTRKQKLETQASALSDKYGKDIDAADEKRRTADRCRDDAFHEIKAAKDEAARQRMVSDPATRQKVMELSQQMAMAQAKGDTATVSRTQRELMSLSALTHEDSLAVDKKCGAMPPQHPAVIQIEALRRETAALDEQVRTLDKNSLAEEAKTSGLTEQQFDLALERILMYLERAKSKSTQRGFTGTELKALAAHREALEAEV